MVLLEPNNIYPGKVESISSLFYFTHWGVKYADIFNYFEWKAMQKLINICSGDFVFKPINKHSSICFCKKGLEELVVWFDTNVINRIGKDTITTIDVRMRILTGMLNNLINLTHDQKREAHIIFVNSFRQANRSYIDYMCKTQGLPF